MLDAFKIKWLLIGDLDCYKDELLKILTYLKSHEIIKTFTKIKELMDVPKVNVKGIVERIKGIQTNLDAQKLHDVFDKFNTGTIDADDEDLVAIIKYMESKYIKSDLRSEILKAISEEDFKVFQQSLHNSNIFIWSYGDLETYYTKLAKGIKGSKDIMALELSYIIADETNNVNDYIKYIDEWQAVCDRI